MAGKEEGKRDHRSDSVTAGGDVSRSRYLLDQ